MRLVVYKINMCNLSETTYQSATAGQILRYAPNLPQSKALGINMTSRTYPLIKSVLGGIYGAQTTKSDAEDISELKKNLEYQPFRDGFSRELIQAFDDSKLSWRDILEECEVMCADTEQEAKCFAEKFLWEATFK
jgi:SMC interacting uncharacterized protein involved in chromosome segregation